MCVCVYVWMYMCAISPHAPHLQRVVHSVDTPRILSTVQALQGCHGLYYVGAYSVDGMGLLEQAAISGQKVAERILAEVQCANRGEAR